MRLVLAAVGRARAGPMRDLFEAYARRLVWPLDLREVEVRRRLAPAALRAEEAKRLRAAVPEGAVVVALDARGRELSSEAFARRLEGWREARVRRVAFLIGGAEGLDPALRESADLVLAFGAMTWPHMLARVMLVEQIYRAQQILAGHPYHRG